ncbi:MAG: B12-binding domain-containing radical SAM protein [Desulfobaccales bacterium]
MNNNVLLINPEINPKTQRKFITDTIRVSFPFSLGHLAGFLLHHTAISLKIVDDQITYLDFNYIDKLLSEMQAPKIIGLTTLTATCPRVYELAAQLKRIDEAVVIVLGGIHSSVLPEEGLKHRSVDVVVRGEGEETLAELIDHIMHQRDFTNIRGISYRKNSQFIHNDDRPLIKDLNTLPAFPYHLFESNLDRYPGFFSIQTSRGCPYKCTFCSQRSISGYGYRYVSTERAIQSIELLENKYHANLIRIMDDNIGANKRRLLNLLDAIIERGINKRVSFEAPMRGDNLDEEILEKLKEANFSLLTFGLETASESLMKAINKGETVQDVVRAINLTAQKKIATGATLIFGLPNETKKDRWDAIRLVSSLPLDSVRFNILTPYPGTPVYNELIKENKILIKENWENFSVQYMWQGDDLPYVPDGTDKYELMFHTMLANLWFYLRPSGIRKLFTKSAAGGNVIFLRRKWYFSRFLFKIMLVSFYLIRRFSHVTLKMLYRKLVSGNK